jgi:hypothetical protein
MKRLIAMTCCVLVFFAGAASAWASCNQISLGSGKHHASTTPGHTHEHHSHSDHNHPHGLAIHCATLNEFLPVATFSPNNDHRIERLLDASATSLSLPSSQDGFRLTHGPPGVASLSFIPAYLFFSVLRV